MVFKKKKDSGVSEGVVDTQKVGIGKDEVLEPPKMPDSESVPKQELSEEDKLLLEQIKSYRAAYGRFIVPDDIANLGEPLLRAEELNLKWAIFQELKKLNEQMEEALK